MEVITKVKEIEQDVIALRRYFHENPEVSMKENNTMAFVVEKLEGFGIKCEIVPDGGIIGILEGVQPGKSIILRSDLDALPMDESDVNLNRKKLVVSKNQGAAHLCGHDAHMAMLLGTAEILSKHRNELKGKVIFAFEQGEENGGGIQKLLNRLIEIGADGVWGIHMKSDIPSGKISVDPGPRMAGAYFFHVEITGKSGHGSRPDLAHSPIDCFHDFYQRLQNIRLQELNPFQPITISLGSVHAGNEASANVIPETLRFNGTSRFLHLEQGKKMEAAFQKTLEQVCKQYDCTYRFLEKISPMDMFVYNNEDCSIIAEEAVQKSLGEEKLINYPAWMASEPFAFYQKYFPGVFAFVGIENEEKGIGAEHHNAHFDIDDDVLYIGVTATIQYVLDFLENNKEIEFEAEKRSVDELFKEMGF